MAPYHHVLRWRIVDEAPVGPQSWRKLVVEDGVCCMSGPGKQPPIRRTSMHRKPWVFRFQKAGIFNSSQPRDPFHVFHQPNTLAVASVQVVSQCLSRFEIHDSVGDSRVWNAGICVCFANALSAPW
jgi:hypothetical protein